jgi:prefoldin subunit 5
MKKYATLTVLIALALYVGLTISDAQKSQSGPNLQTTVLIAPDAKSFVPLTLTPKDLIDIRKEYAVESEQDGVTYIQLKSWEELHWLSQKSTEAMNTTIADLKIRVNNLESRLKNLEAIVRQ